MVASHFNGWKKKRETTLCTPSGCDKLKGQSSHWINETYLHGSFAWQSGYAAFSYSLSLVPTVKQYIANQHEHHRHKTFREEVEVLFRKAGIEYNPAYMMQGFVPADEP